MEYNCTESWIFRTWLILSAVVILLIGVQVYQYLILLGLLYAGLKIVTKALSKKVNINERGVFITGCDTGMGHEVALRLTERGFTVFAGCLRPDGEGAKALQQTKNGTLHVVPLDVTKESSVDAAVAAVEKKLPESGLWAIINNAGIEKFGHVEFARLEMMKLIAEVNYFGMVRFTKAFLPMLRKSKGRVINVTSVKGRMALQTDVAYVSSKWAAEAFSDCLRREMLRFGVKVIVVEPGNFGAATSIVKGDNLKMVESDLNDAWNAASPEVQAAYGRGCIDGLLNGVRSAGDGGAKTLDNIFWAMQDALENENPRYRYLVHGTWPFDKYCVLARLHELLPEAVMDLILTKR